jgi:hypothetical protein
MRGAMEEIQIIRLIVNRQSPRPSNRFSGGLCSRTQQVVSPTRTPKGLAKLTNGRGLTTLARQSRTRWVYFLPIIHLCASFTSLVGIVIPSLQYWAFAWTFILILDLPVSLVSYGLAWKHGALAMIWIFIAGTYWWYLLSRGTEFLIDSMRHRKPIALFSPNRNRDDL